MRLLPDPSDLTHIARVELDPAQKSASALFAAIPNRHTNRAAYDLGRPVTQGQLDALSSLVVLPVSQKQNNDGWLRGTLETQIPTSAAFGALVVRAPLDPIARLRVGRIWQRIHLSATVQGLGMQPLCQVPERIDRERSTGLAPDFTDAMAVMLSPRSHAIMTFCIGYPTSEALRSPRRPASEVVLS